jgi:hypothetical protein
MTYNELKSFLETLNESQLNQQVVVSKIDDEEAAAIQVDGYEIQDEDIYWDHSDCYGNKEAALASYGDNAKDEDLLDLTIVPKGTVFLTT